MDQESPVQNLLFHSYEQKPIEFQHTFNDIVTQRISNAINDRKIELAQSLFNNYADADEPEQDNEQELETETQEDNQDGEVA